MTTENDYLCILANALAVVEQQAKDEALWFNPETAPEAYVQKSLRYLHAVLEDDASVVLELERHFGMGT